MGQPGPGIEIGGSAHNPLGIPGTINVDYTDDMSTIFKEQEEKICGEKLPVDRVDEGDLLKTFEADSVGWIYSSHVVEHFPNLFSALDNWKRVVRNGGLIYAIVPQRDALPIDMEREVTTAEHFGMDYILKRTVDNHPVAPGHGIRGHYHVFTSESFSDAIRLYNKLPKMLGYQTVNSPGVDYIPGWLEILDICDPDDKVGNGFAVVMKVHK